MKQKQNTKNHDRFISDKGLLFNLIFLDAICLVFGVINLFSNDRLSIQVQHSYEKNFLSTSKGVR